MTTAPGAHPFARALPATCSAAMLRAQLRGATLIGDGATAFDGVAALSSSASHTLTFCDAVGDTEVLAATASSVVIVRQDVVHAPRPDQAFIAVADVRAAFIDAVAWLLPGTARPVAPAGIDRRARIEPTASVSPAAFVGADVTIGARTCIGPGAVLYDDVHVGSDCVIGPQAVIGWVGLAYHDDAHGRRRFFPHLAGVRIGERVDIGAQTSVCRGMLSHTTIGDDAKLGSLVYVSHGVIVGARAWLSAGTAVAGHSHIADGALLGIGSIVVDNVTIGTGARVGGGSVVVRHADAGENLLGVPAAAVPAMRRFGPTPRD
ncbi:MAG TPA: DapH/DapD/GlmU-related protein [Casimicrobiaceae bacterium]|nr:DapH/DapD/GlmU-related protein [Casimicrobiaceae bacterium]